MLDPDPDEMNADPQHWKASPKIIFSLFFVFPGEEHYGTFSGVQSDTKIKEDLKLLVKNVAF
jgi:hypothetical protein